MRYTPLNDNFSGVKKLNYSIFYIVYIYSYSQFVNSSYVHRKRNEGTPYLGLECEPCTLNANTALWMRTLHLKCNPAHWMQTLHVECEPCTLNANPAPLMPTLHLESQPCTLNANPAPWMRTVRCSCTSHSCTWGSARSSPTQPTGSAVEGEHLGWRHQRFEHI